MSGMLEMAQVAGPVLAAALDALKAAESEFGVVDLRETFKDSPHDETQSVYLRSTPWPLGDIRSIQDDLRVVNWPVLQLDPRWATILQTLQEVSGLSMARAMLVRLRPGGTVGEHSDQGLYADSTERFHWVLTTNPGCTCVVGGEEYRDLKPGSLWWFDKSQLHGAVNSGKTPRVHLIFDGWRKIG